MSWDFKINRPGTFEVVVLASEQKYGRGWEGGHQLAIEVAGQTLRNTVANHGKEENPSNPYWKYVVSNMARVTLDRPGKYNLSLKQETIQAEQQLGLTLASVKLVPVQP